MLFYYSIRVLVYYIRVLWYYMMVLYNDIKVFVCIDIILGYTCISV